MVEAAPLHKTALGPEALVVVVLCLRRWLRRVRLRDPRLIQWRRHRRSPPFGPSYPELWPEQPPPVEGVVEEQPPPGVVEERHEEEEHAPAEENEILRRPNYVRRHFDLEALFL